MDTSTDKKQPKQYTPISPFDGTLYEDYSMYEGLVYTRDLSLFDSNEVMMNRGNIIHFYECKNVKPRKVGGDIIDAEISSEEDLTEEETHEEETPKEETPDEETPDE